MKYMLDTNICIYAMKKKPASVLEAIHQNEIHGLCISAITLSELAMGIQKSAYPEKNTLALLQFLTIMEIIPFFCYN